VRSTGGGAPAASARLAALRLSDTGRAAGMGLAVIASNVLTLAFTVVFARLLGSAGYGSLAALGSAFLILSIPGSAAQVTVARELARADADQVPNVSAAVATLMRRLVVATAVAAVAAIVLREPLAAVMAVEEGWAAAATVPSAGLWLLVCIQRGVLQGTGGYRLVGLSMVGEAAGRLFFGLALAGAGLGVTGAFLGTTASLVATLAILARSYERALGRRSREHASTRSLAARLSSPAMALALFAVLQNVDVIVVKHLAPAPVAGAYAAASLSAKVIVWIAVGLALYLLPESARRATAGLETRRLLLGALALVALAGVTMTAAFAALGPQLLGLVFGAGYSLAGAVLPWLALAMTLLGASYLAAQYLLALERPRFLVTLAAAAVLEPVVLTVAGGDLGRVAVALLVLQLALAAALLATSLSSRGAGTRVSPRALSSSP